MVAGLWIINAFDLVLTILAHRHHLLDETNPIAASLLPLGPAALLLYKTVLVTGASTVLILARRRILAEFASGTMLIVYALVAVQWKLCFEMYDLSCTNGAEIGRVCDPAGWTSYLPF